MVQMHVGGWKDEWQTKISRKMKGKVVMSCVTPAYLYGLEMVTPTETPTEATGLREQLGQVDCQSEEVG